MTPEYIYVFFLLCLPQWLVDDYGHTFIGNKQSPAMWTALKKLALEAEVVGPHENWIPNCFCGEFRFVYGYSKVIRNYPPISDRYRFKNSFYLEAIKINQDYWDRLDVWDIGLDPYRTERIGSLKTETSKRGAIWSYVKNVNNPNEMWLHIRSDLNKLRNALGEKKYYEGSLPYPIPTWE